MLRTGTIPPSLSPESQLARAKEVMAAESSAMAEVARRLDDDVVRAIQLILDTEGCVVVTGMGKAGLVGQKTAATLASTGTRAHFVHPAEACHGDLGRISSEDVVLAFSHSGQTPELIQILPYVRQIGARIVAVTSRKTSLLSRAADVTIAYGPIEEACPVRLAPTTSCAVMLGIGDALALVLMDHRGFGAEDFGRYHPAGSLGRKLQRVDEVMRTGARLRIARSELSVREAFLAVQRPGRRTGAICLVDADGRLDGIFTDSDLAKLLERGDLAFLTLPIRQVMTSQPITANLGWLVQDVVELFKQHQVSEIPVIDSDHRPVGLVDITDLVDLLPEAA